MDLKTHINAIDPDSRESLASACGTTMGHIRNVMYGLRLCSAELAVAIEQATQGAVTRKDLRPDDWHRIWPELIGTEGAPSVPSVGTDQCGTSDQKGSASSDSPTDDGIQCTRMDMSAPNQIGLLTACPSATELTSKDTDLTSTLTDCPHRAVSASAIADCTSSNE